MRRTLSSALLSVTLGIVALAVIGGPAHAATPPPQCNPPSTLVLLTPTVTQVNGQNYATSGTWACATTVPAGFPRCTSPQVAAVVAGQGGYCVTVVDQLPPTSSPPTEVDLIECVLSPDGQCLVSRVNQTLDVLMWGGTT